MKLLAADTRAIVLDFADAELERGIVPALMGEALGNSFGDWIDLVEADDFPDGVQRVLHVTDSVVPRSLDSLDPSVAIERALVIHSPDQPVMRQAHDVHSTFDHVFAASRGIPVRAILRGLTRTGRKLQDELGLPMVEKRFVLNNSRDRVALRDSLADFVEEISKEHRRSSAMLVQRAVCTQEELLMNAVFDANPRLRDLMPRGEDSLELGEDVILEWGYDGRYLGISVSDSFGTMSFPGIAKCFEFLVRGRERRRYVQMQQDSPGAGIGLFMVLERVLRLVFSVEADRATSAVAVIDVSRTLLQSRQVPRELEYHRCR